MKVRKILLTGDDGFNSGGIRLLAHILKKDYSVKIAATLNQQSGTGGTINLKDDIAWGEEKVEGVPALWVDGSPVDAIEVAQGYYKDSFDVVISGINYGKNLGYSLVSSGTFSAAVRSLAVNLAPKAIAMSWQVAARYYFLTHNGAKNISNLLDYPGLAAKDVIKQIFDNDFYGKELVNVNFPKTPTNKTKIVKVARDITRLWAYPRKFDWKRKISSQTDNFDSKNMETDITTDVGALHKGYITISPVNYLT